MHSVPSHLARSALALLSPLALMACATPSLDEAGRVAQAPPVPPGWSIPAPPVGTDVEQYWRMLDDPLLTQFVTAARDNNLELRQAAARAAQARASLRLARAGFLPNANGTAGISRDIGDFSRDEFDFTIGADVSWQADLFGRISSDVRASQAELVAAGYSVGDLQRLIVGTVAQQTIAARSAAVQLRIARDTLANQDENLQIARWRLQAGLVSSLDVEQARAQRAQTAASIPALESDIAASANAISTLIGEEPGRVRLLLSEPAAVPDPPASVGLGAPAELLRRRPDIRAAEARLAADAARIDLAEAQLLPLVRLSGNIGTGATGIGDLFDIITGNLFAGISQLIYDGGRTRAQIGIARAAADGSLAAWRLSVLQALEEVETAAIDLDAARDRVALFIEARDAAQNAALLARSQYQAGLIDFEVLLTAENQLLSARNSVVAAQAARASSFVRLTQALGGGWSEGDVRFQIDPPEIILTGEEPPAAISSDERERDGA